MKKNLKLFLIFFLLFVGVMVANYKTVMSATTLMLRQGGTGIDTVADGYLLIGNGSKTQFGTIASGTLISDNSGVLTNLPNLASAGGYSVEYLAAAPYITVCASSSCDYETDGTDDDIQIQEALNYVENLGGGTVLIKAGNYNIDSTYMTVPSYTHVMGEGNSTVITRIGSSITKLFDATLSTSSIVSDMRIINSSYVSVACGNNFVVKNMELSGGSDVIYSLGRKNVWILNNYIHDYTNHGILISNGNKNVVIDSNRIVSIENTTGAYGVGYRGVYLLDSSNVMISKNFIAHHSARGVFVNRNSDYVQILENIFEDNFHHVSVENDTPLLLEGSSDYNIIDGNIFKTTNTSQSRSSSVKIGNASGDPYPSSYNIVSNNIFDNPVYGIRIWGGYSNKISGNIFKTTGTGIDIKSEATSTMVSNNAFWGVSNNILDSGYNTVIGDQKMNGDLVGTWDGLTTTTMPYLPNTYTMDNFSDGVDYVKMSTSSKSKYDTAYSWGDHSTYGYFKANGSVSPSASWSFSGLYGINNLLEISAASSSLGTINSGTWNGSAIDISSYTNLSADLGVSLSGDQLRLNIGNLTPTSSISDDNEFSVNQASGHFKVLWSTIKSFLKTYFDAIYLSLTGGTMQGDIDMNSNDIRNVDEAYFASSSVGIVRSGTWNGSDIDISDYTNLVCSATGLELSDDSIIFSAGYSLPLTATTTNHESFYDTPSSRIISGTGLSWSENTINSSWTISGNNIYNNNTNNVGIGTLSPSSLLSILSVGKNSSLFSVGSTTESDTLFIGKNKKIGIGTINPQSLLSIVQGAGNTPLQLRGNNTSGTIGIGFRMSSSEGSDNAQIKVNRTNLPNSGDVAFEFINTKSGSMSESMRINGYGFVGIGTTTPSSKLDVYNGYITQDGVFGGTYFNDATTTQAIPAGTTYTRVNGFVNEEATSNVTASSSELIITIPGVYHIDYSITGTVQTANTSLKSAMFLNDVELNNCHDENIYSTVNDIDHQGDDCRVNIKTVPATLDVRVRHDKVGSVNYELVYGGFGAELLGRSR